mgnify:CR=1 FL=1
MMMSVTLDGGFTGLGDAAAQADQAMRNVRVLLEEAGSRMEHICKITTYITDRAWREPVYAVIGRHLGSIAPVGTGLIVNGLAINGNVEVRAMLWTPLPGMLKLMLSPLP